MSRSSFLFGLPLALLVGCAPESWSLTDCQLSSTVELSMGGASTSAGFGGCQAYWDNETDTVTLQLMKGGTSGSFALPGDGWLTLRYAGASAENTSFSVTGWSTDAVPLTTMQAQYQYDPAVGGFGSAFGSGSITVATNQYSSTGVGVHLAATSLDLDIGGGNRLSGSFTAIGGSFLAATDGGGGAGCADDGASCVEEAEGYQNECESGGSQTACACGVITLSNCFIRNGCYAEAGADTSLTASDIRASCESAQQTLSDVGNPGACGSCL
jgi:hypothetical protein